MFKPSPPIVLTIAGSDSSGGAGIQADIKSISATGGYACSVITALTAQNTQGVSGIHSVPVEFVEQQLDSVFSDLNVIAVKVGMLNDAQIIKSVARRLRQYQPQYLVVDPVMVATSGDKLLEDSAVETLKQELIPLATLITPNLPEAAVLTGLDLPDNEDDMVAMTDALKATDALNILLKGGHLETDDSSTDLLITSQKISRFSAKRHASKNTHGTGCTLSSAIASYLAQGQPLEQAVSMAKNYITKAIAHADELEVGNGRGPVHHFYTD
ncbi:Hydroxymethylpyrimidine/phosphomethylpyrimidine kinase [Vibrio nigripulchritudo SFn27]|uniref:hydroxymethylpyrimidine kinase n=1 Tax=Vibrio nigripulchritudo TaxID=28173 RepID=U4K2C1_9VIBR|nr:bifunctional hydroxymethylpyrimidine kinase/phosphomethylpyrimidine kinase [Vibrio nigripulchritudo]KJY80388.1 hydroxymethylpyrimidine kinase [Vibrio nigripulchritudo]CCN36305.1 Hydroxymethylpyrimidine/phosphomethylpyrimidine kinase [Vibrio nigripulchritudo AM115]CCN39387.1 Hydroxymethylpyrimidine/phosphomethylpyrimidine kinase [Vibrio nigripulchritudo FTn2]CCN63516.1 Hydroxymethylpyrimidine/phosphomethylpyrimidine kinase [Vibrio nigripulchritudo POn4]CCN78068.1 Hydroxymethylpyrimidine/phos